MKVRYTPSANAELGAVLEYIGERSLQGARKVQARIGDMISLFSQYPYAGSQTDDPGLRYVMASPYPYLIFYEVNDAEDEVVIIAVRDSAGFRAAMIYGYARVSTDAQDLASHLAALKAVGCARIFREKISGAPAEHP